MNKSPSTSAKDGSTQGGCRVELYERAGGVGSSRVLNEHQPVQPSERASGERIGGSNFHQRASDQQQQQAQQQQQNELHT